MKTARFVLKIVAMALALVALVCAIIGFSDKIGEVLGLINREVHASEYDDYEE